MPAGRGTTTPRFFGGDEADLGQFAWFVGNSENLLRPVARLKPNPWGLYDMLTFIALILAIRERQVLAGCANSSPIPGNSH